MKGRISYLTYFLEKRHQLHQFPISLLPVELKDRNPIVNLQGKRLNQIINNNYVLELPVFHDSQILDVHFLLSLETIVSAQYIFDVAMRFTAFCVYFFDSSICVLFGCGCECVDLEILGYGFKKDEGVRPNADFEKI